jgi:glycosyltransferase involved in cell wall biosynthesis
LISVMMRAYNAEPFLAEAISSVLRQSYPHFELLVADDCSTDRTLEIAQAYALADPRVRVLSGPHRGEIAQANRCLREARFPWIAVLDSDDVALPDRLLLTMRAAEDNPEVVLWGGAAILIDRDGRPMRRARVGPCSIPEYDRAVSSGKVIYMMSPTVMYRRGAALVAGGYDQRMTGADDVELMDRMARLGPALCLPMDLARYRVHGTSISSTRFALQQRVFDYVDARNQAALRGEDLDINQYIDRLACQPAPLRVLRWVRDLGREKYRAAVVHLAERRFAQAGVAAALALTLDPAHALRRIGNRVFNPAQREGQQDER